MSNFRSIEVVRPIHLKLRLGSETQLQVYGLKVTIIIEGQVADQWLKGENTTHGQTEIKKML